jgi:hypothetical protein
MIFLIIAPAHEAIEYETRSFRRGFQNDTSPYQGWPNDESDALWEEMYSSKYPKFVSFLAILNLI